MQVFFFFLNEDADYCSLMHTEERKKMDTSIADKNVVTYILTITKH